MDPRDDDIPVEPEDPTRPTWLLEEPTSVEETVPVDETAPVDEPRLDAPFEPVPTMDADGPPFVAEAEAAAEPAPARQPSTRRAALMGALAGAVVAALVSGAVVTLANDDDSTTSGSQRTVAPVAVANGQGLDVHAVLSAVEDAVVAINIEGVGEFGGVVRAAGSGMVFDPSGLIRTTNHVVEGATTITVTLADGRDVDADLVGSIPSNDVALVRVRNAKDLQAVTFGSSSALRVGDPVVAIGNALGLGGTPSVTTGIVSALGRDLDASNGEHLTDLIQTDAAIYQGNSGGPLVDAEGEVVGVNTAVATSQANGAAENLGFALPIDQLKPLIDKLKAGGGDVRGTAFLGVRTVDLDNVQSAIRDRLTIKTDHGAFVGEVVDGSGAQAAGIKAGDVITAIDGKDVKSAADVGDAIAKLQPGDRVRITLERDGKEQTVTATLGSRGTTR
jgi:S1-C subfamily serine protease